MLNIEQQTTHGSITVRPIHENDVNAFRTLRLEALQNHPEAFGSDYAENLTFPPNYWQERLQANINSNQGIIYVAASADQLIAMMGCHRERGSKVHHTASIWGVYLQPAWRGAGIAQQLLSACEDWAREHGVRMLNLAVATTNTSAIRAYARAGFQVYGVAPEMIHVGGKYYDELLMLKRLARI